MRRISVFDSTLRDGAQGNGISFSVEDKLLIVRLLDRLGVDYIEAGNPVSNPKDAAFFQRLSGIVLQRAKLAAFGSTCRKTIPPDKDEGLLALLKANTACCVLFGKSWKFQVDHVLETTAAENFRMIEESCRYLKQHGKEVVFDAEHFFDGFRDDPHFAMESLRAALRGGADILCLCDTNGGAFPHQAASAIKTVCRELHAPVSVHFHDDGGMAVANTVEGVLAGAEQVQGTLIGFGERCGNANLSAIIPNLQLKLGFDCIPQEQLNRLTIAARELAAIANLELPPGAAFVGVDAFSHKAGMHADGVLKTSRSFEHIDPYLVGNLRRFPASEISGRAVVYDKIKEILPGAEIDSQDVGMVLQEMKELEARGYQFEGADASFELLVRKRLLSFTPFFELLYYHIYTDYGGNRDCGASATVKVRVGEEVQLMAAEGNGPVNALDTALRKALELFYPAISLVKLTDYKVRVLDSKNATASGVRVFITSAVQGESFTTVGVSGDVVAASWKALEDSLEYLLLKSEAQNRQMINSL